MRTRRTVPCLLILLTILVLTGGSALVFGQGGTGKMPPPRMPPIRTLPPRKNPTPPTNQGGETRPKIVGSGEVRPLRYVKLTSEASGRIQEIYVQPGAEIKKGQALVRIELQSSTTEKATQYSPLDGVIADISSRVGETVSGGLSDPPLMTIADMSKTYVEVNIDGRDISKVAVGQPAKIVVDAFHKQEIGGLVIRKDPRPVSASGPPEFRVTIELSKIPAEIQKRLRPGMSATAMITATTKSNAKQ